MKRVLTFGVFDTLHRGHIRLFERAKQHGNYLIVAVQNDESILKYKPNTRVLNTTEERVYMVRSIRYVDEVVCYDDVDEDIKKIDFDVLVKGQDQSHRGFVNAVNWCKESGKEVYVLKRTKGISSSIIREFQIKNQ